MVDLTEYAIDLANMGGMWTNIGVSVSAAITQAYDRMRASKPVRLQLKCVNGANTYYVYTCEVDYLAWGSENYVTIIFSIYPHAVYHLIVPAAGYNKWMWGKQIAS